MYAGVDCCVDKVFYRQIIFRLKDMGNLSFSISQPHNHTLKYIILRIKSSLWSIFYHVRAEYCYL